MVLCENKKISGRLLKYYNIQKVLITFNEHTKDKDIDKILSFLISGKDAALITDAGTPGISDPGGKLIKQAFKANIKISPIPGPSAVTAALSISGFPANEYLFLGFPPHKKRKKKFFEKINDYKNTIVFFESPHRIKKTLKELADILEKNSYQRKIVVCRELTKKFEEIIRGKVNEIVQKFDKDVIIKGEFTIVVAPITEKND